MCEARVIGHGVLARPLAEHPIVRLRVAVHSRPNAQSVCMNLTDELRKLAEMHRDGQLNDQEFAAAKTRLLGTEAQQPAPSAWAAPTASGVKPGKKIYRSSRWSAGNLFFPDQLTLADDGMHFQKGALFGSQEEHINYRAVASLRLKNGIFLSNLTVETSGGSQPIYLNGLWKGAAKEIQSTVQSAQIAR